MREHLPPEARAAEDAKAHREMVLTWVQPGLAGLMDGSVSTLAPIFAAAFATGDTWQTFLVGLAASVGAGISMGFTEAASDDGTIRAGVSGEARDRIGGDDRDRRPWTCAPVTDPGFQDRNGHRDGSRVRRTLDDCLDPESLHGNAILAGGAASRGRRLARVCRGNPDRKRLTCQRENDTCSNAIWCADYSRSSLKNSC